MEVLIMISNEAPHIYLHNGVSYSDMELMANVLLNSLVESEKGIVSIFVKPNKISNLIEPMF